jgi:hypothetical protein
VDRGATPGEVEILGSACPISDAAEDNIIDEQAVAYKF